MTAPLTLPGTIPGLLRRGSPVIDDRGRRATVTVWFVRQDFVTWTIVGDDLDEIPKWQHGEGLPADVALDLADPTSRAHAAWYLGGVGASWHLSCDGFRRWEIHGGETPRAGFMLEYEGVGAEHRRMRSRPNIDVTDVTALDHLNPDDPRLLPDGSRWVDAEALRLVCLHVAGVSA